MTRWLSNQRDWAQRRSGKATETEVEVGGMMKRRRKRTTTLLLRRKKKKRQVFAGGKRRQNLWAGVLGVDWSLLPVAGESPRVSRSWRAAEAWSG